MTLNVQYPEPDRVTPVTPVEWEKPGLNEQISAAKLRLRLNDIRGIPTEDWIRELANTPRPS